MIAVAVKRVKRKSYRKNYSSLFKNTRSLTKRRKIPLHLHLVLEAVVILIHLKIVMFLRKVALAVKMIRENLDRKGPLKKKVKRERNPPREIKKEEVEAENRIEEIMAIRGIEVDLLLKIVKVKGLIKVGIKEEIKDPQVEIEEGLEKDDDVKT